MGDVAELLAVVDAVVGALRRQEVPYFITGSFASSVHGEFRATNDVDLVAQLDASNLEPLFAELSQAFVADIDQATDALDQGTSFNLIHSTTFLKVDIFPCTSEFDRVATQRAVSLAIPGANEPLRVASLEDILLAKLRWFRLGDESSETQRRDIARLVELNRDRLDHEYAHLWAKQLGVDDLLAQLLK